MDHWSKILLCGIILVFWGIENTVAQNSDQEPNRLSMGVMGAVTTGHLNVGSAFQSGVNANFEFQEQLNSTFGFNIRYVATPEIALQTNVVFGRFSILSDIYPDDALSFDNNYVTTHVTTQLSLVRLFGASAKNFNLFGSFGTGLMFNNISINSEHPYITQSDVTPADHPFQTFFTTFGGGIRFNLGHRLDSYAQYEYSSANRDIIDGNFIGELLNLGGSAEISNSWSAVTFGIQFKFGGSNTDADWPSTARIIIPEPLPGKDIFERLEELLARQADMFGEEIDQLTSRIDSLEIALLAEKQKKEEEISPENEEMAKMIRELQAKVESLESALAAEREKPETEITITEQADPAETPPTGEFPKTKVIQRVRLQPEMIGLKVLPSSPPVEIALVPDLPEEDDQAAVLAEARETSEDETEEPESQESGQIVEQNQPEEEIIFKEELAETETEEAFDTTPEITTADSSEILDDAGIQKTESIKEEREDVVRKADSLRVIDSIEALKNKGRGMSEVHADVTRPDTADLEIPQPEEKEPEFPKPESKRSQPEQDKSKEAAASADVDMDSRDSASPVEVKVAESSVESDTIKIKETISGGEDEIASAQRDTTEALDTPAQEPEEGGLNWTWRALIAVVVLGTVFYLANVMKPKSGSDNE